MVGETAATWLHSLRQAGPEASGWGHFIQTYEPFIRAMLSGKGLQPSTIDDVTQEVLVVVVRRLPEFERQRTGSFRAWLRAITVNCLSDHRKSKKCVTGGDEMQELIGALQDPESDLSMAWNQQHAQHVLRVLLETTESEFESTTVEIFRALALDGKPVDEVAAKFGKSKGACYVARSKVLKRMRELVREHFGDDAGLIDAVP